LRTRFGEVFGDLAQRSPRKLVVARRLGRKPPAVLPPDRARKRPAGRRGSSFGPSSLGCSGVPRA